MDESISRSERLIEVLDQHGNRISSQLLINDILQQYFQRHKVPFSDKEYTFIIRHITTPELREYFHELATNYNLELSKSENLDYPKLKISIPLSIFDKAEWREMLSDEDNEDKVGVIADLHSQNIWMEGDEYVLGVGDWIFEFDENGYYTGCHNAKPKFRTNRYPDSWVQSATLNEAKKLIKGFRGIKINETRKCCVCNERFTMGWQYETSDYLLYLCCECKSTKPTSEHHPWVKIIYTPMKG